MFIESYNSISYQNIFLLLLIKISIYLGACVSLTYRKIWEYAIYHR